MHTIRLAILSFSALLVSSSPVVAVQGASVGGALPTESVADASAAPVTAANVMQSERFWPFHVRLREPWTPTGATEGLETGIPGVLLRVEEGTHAVVEWGRDGRHRVPLAKTDLLAQANRIRRGDEQKTIPNAVMAFGNWMIDAAAEAGPRRYRLQNALQKAGFLTVHADPTADSFPALAKAMAPLADRHGVLTVIVPQGGHPDSKVYQQLREADWPTAFILKRLAVGTTRGLLGESAPGPAVLLITKEGRRVYQGVWKPGAEQQVAAALDSEFAAGGD